MYLHELPPGRTAVIDTIGDTTLRGRLRDLGFIGGSTVECVARAPLDGPSAYLIRGTLIALRQEDACSVVIRDGM